MERSCLFARNRAGQTIRASLHHVPWPLEEAEAEIEQNDLAASIGICLPNEKPVLYYSRRLAVYIWPAELGAADADGAAGNSGGFAVGLDRLRKMGRLRANSSEDLPQGLERN